MPTVKEIFDQMPTRFRPEKAQGVSVVVQYDITGEGGGTWHVGIKDGTCTTSEGAASSPNLTLTMTAQDWIDMVSGKLSGQMAFMSGKLKLKGDMSLAMKLATFFGI
ncbi:MAG: SCP2 sterol-binding domain-containing protein [Candidatus Methylomirabilia bacterium]